MRLRDFSGNQHEPPQRTEVHPGDDHDDVGYLIEHDVGVEQPVAPHFGLRNCASLQQPARYRE